MASVPVETEVPKKTVNKHMLVFEDKEHVEHTLQSLNKLRRNKQFCDVILQVGSTKDVHEIHAHRSVLASVSPYLFDLFSTDSGNNGHIRQYKFNGSFDLDAFQRLVDYAYTARLEVPRDKVKAVYMVANRLRMFEAAKLCGQYLASTLNPSNCISIRSIPGVSSDPDLLNSVDNYIRQNIEQVVKSTDLHALPKIQVELLQNSNEEMDATNERHLCDMVLDWIRKSFDADDLTMGSITEKVHMLYLNPDHTLHDCFDIENGDVKDSEIIQDYKKLSRRISVPPSSRVNRKPKQKQNPPAKPRQFLYTRSDSSSSLSSIGEEDEKDWKIVATIQTGGHTIMALVVVTGKLCVLTVKQRLHTPVNSPSTSRPGSVEKTNSYTVIPPMSSPRCAVGTAELDGKLLVCGGYDRGECLKTVEVYDRAANKWTALKPMLIPRGRFDIAVVDDKVYAIGGCDGTKDLNSAEMLDTQENKWKSLPSLPIVRSNAGACSLGEKIYVIGGWNGQRGLTRCDVYDPQTQTWTPIAHLTTGRYQAGVATLNGEVYAVGGCDTWNCLNSVEKYSPETDTWEVIGPMNTARRGCGVAVYKGKLYVVGGHDGVRSLCTVEIYDPHTDAWSAGPSLTSCRANVGVSLVGDRLYAVGGFNGKNFLNTIEYLDPQTNEWTTFVTKEVTANLIFDDEKQEETVEIGQSNDNREHDILICDQNGITEKCKEFEKQNSCPVMRQNEKTPS